jgi:hypothetical protein
LFVRLVRAAGVGLADSVDALVGLHLDEEEVAGPDADDVGLDVGDLDVAASAGGLTRACGRASWPTNLAAGSAVV